MSSGHRPGTLMVALSALAACAGEPSRVPGDARGELTISGEPSCDECEIALEEIALLDDPGDPTSMREDAAGRGCMIGRLATGEYVSSGAVGGGRLLVYDGAGPAVRSMGRPGQGPGELGERSRIVVGPNDTLFVMDDSNARLGDTRTRVLEPQLRGYR